MKTKVEHGVWGRFTDESQNIRTRGKRRIQKKSNE